jgi:hypothetical protein
MPARKKPPSPQSTLFAAPLLAPKPNPDSGLDLPSAQAVAPLSPREATPSIPTADPGLDSGDLDELDDYDDTCPGCIDAAGAEPVPRLRLLDPPRTVSVIVEATESGFAVSRLRHNGTTSATVMWTREELKEFVGRAQAALEVIHE